MTMVYLVRQGQTDWNLFKKFNGCTDTELNQTGIAQAKLQADNLRSISFDACFCSPQKRACQTCEIICKGPIVFDDRLVEINCGDFEGTEETADALASFWQAIRNGDMGTESFKEFTKRNCDFCDMIMKDHKRENVIIVTHSANARIINYYFNGKPYDYDFGKSVIENGGLLIYEN
ncbi:MAG: histidine phosphatase family protein [Eubacteriales bacterium]